MNTLTLDLPPAVLAARGGVEPAITEGPLRLLVTIARDWPDRSAVYSQLHVFHRRCHRTGRHLTLVHGACPEGDQMVPDWLERFGDELVDEDPHPADWDLCGAGCPQRPHRIRKRPGDVVHPGREPDYCPVAGPRRNRVMVAANISECLAFVTPRSRGAKGTAVLARAAGIPTLHIHPGVK